MTIENVFNSAKIRMIYLLLVFGAAILMLYSLFDGSGLQLHRNIFIVSIVMWLVYLFMHLVGYYYVGIGVKQKNLVLRFYNVHPFLRRYRAIEMPLNSFKDYEIKTSLFGLKKTLIVTRNTANGAIPYPPVNISAYSTTDLRKLKEFFKQLLMANNKSR